MAVVVTKAHGTKLSDVNGFYRVEDYNLPPSYVGYSASRILGNVTFANAGTLKGCMMRAFLVSNDFTTVPTNGIMACLFSNINTFTANASTEVITTTTNHGYDDGDMVAIRIEPGAVIPGGLTSEHAYYVRNSTANTFQISLTPDGAIVNITSNGSGTLSCANALAWKKQTLDDIFGSHITDYRNWYDMLIVSEFDTYKTGTSLSVTTDANKYWIGFYTLTSYFGGVDLQNTWQFSYCTTTALRTFDSTVFAVWCTNEVSFTDGDCLLVFKHTIIDKSFTVSGAGQKARTGTMLNYWASLIIGYDPTQTYPYMLDTEETVVASYTMTIQDFCMCHSNAGWRIGRSDHPVTSANMFKIIKQGSTVPGSAGNNYLFITTAYVETGYSNVALNVAFYGEYPTKSYTTLTNNEIATSKVLEVDDDMTSKWVAGEKVVVTKNNGNVLGDVDIYTIDTLDATSVTLTTGLSDPKLAGGYVLRANCFNACVDGYGISLKSEIAGTVPVHFITFGISPNFTMKGVYGYNFILFNGVSTRHYMRINPAFQSQNLVEDCFFESDKDAYGLYHNTQIGEKGVKLNRVLLFRLCTFQTSYFSVAKAYAYKVGAVYVWDCKVFSTYRTSEWAQTINSSSILPTYDIRNYERMDYNSYAPAYFSGVNCYYDNVKFFVPDTTNIEYPQIYISNLIDPIKINNIGIEGKYRAFWVSPNVSTNVNITNSNFGQVFPNTYDMYITAGAYSDVHFDNCTGLVGLDTADLEGVVDGSKFRFTSYNGVVGDDRTYQPFGETQRCGTGLTDTTTLVSTDTYSVRMKPTSSTDSHHWEQDVPTGNIQNKDMQISVWVKINHANYWGGTNRLPRLTITYDGTSTLYCQASETTDAQKLYVNFTPLTTIGKIKVTIDGYTDATGSDAYFYFGHFGVLYPTGYALDLADLDNWDRGLPVTPTISTVTADAGTLLDALTANHQITGSVGKKISDLKNASYIVDGEIIL